MCTEVNANFSAHRSLMSKSELSALDVNVPEQ